MWDASLASHSSRLVLLQHAVWRVSHCVMQRCSAFWRDCVVHFCRRGVMHLLHHIQVDWCYWCITFRRVMHHIQTCDASHSDVWCITFRCVMHHIQMCDASHSDAGCLTLDDWCITCRGVMHQIQIADVWCITFKSTVVTATRCVMRLALSDAALQCVAVCCSVLQCVAVTCSDNSRREFFVCVREHACVCVRVCVSVCVCGGVCRCLCVWLYVHVILRACQQVCACAHVYLPHCVAAVQGGEDAWDALNCRSLSAKEPIILGLFCGQWRIKIRHSMHIRPCTFPIISEKSVVFLLCTVNLGASRLLRISSREIFLSLLLLLLLFCLNISIVNHLYCLELSSSNACSLSSSEFLPKTMIHNTDVNRVLGKITIIIINWSECIIIKCSRSLSSFSFHCYSALIIFIMEQFVFAKYHIRIMCWWIYIYIYIYIHIYRYYIYLTMNFYFGTIWFCGEISYSHHLLVDIYIYTYLHIHTCI